jgi:hypothetical protein
MRRDDLHEQPALVMSLADEANIPEPEIAEAAVDELRGSARGARTEVAAIDERDSEARTRCLGCDSGADDAASDHEQVEGLLSEPVAGLLARDYVHSGFVQAFRP